MSVRFLPRALARSRRGATALALLTVACSNLLDLDDKTYDPTLTASQAGAGSGAGPAGGAGASSGGSGQGGTGQTGGGNAGQAGGGNAGQAGGGPGGAGGEAGAAGASGLAGASGSAGVGGEAGGAADGGAAGSIAGAGGASGAGQAGAGAGGAGAGQGAGGAAGQGAAGAAGQGGASGGGQGGAGVSGASGQSGGPGGSTSSGGASGAGAGGAGASGGSGASGAGSGGCEEPHHYYFDSDGDGYGSPMIDILVCEPPGAGWTSVAGDCDDGNAQVHPGQTAYFKVGYAKAGSPGGVSFDYDCNATEDSAPGVIQGMCEGKTLPQCASGGGYKESARSGMGANPVCGSTTKVSCVAQLLSCMTMVDEGDYPAARCR